MATILFTWELGAGLGHMLPMRPLAEGLVRARHRVFVALRNLATATPVLGKSGVTFLPAPYRPGGRACFRRTFSMAHILANVGWDRPSELFGLACGWRNLYRLVRPDLIIFDHSPTALLASRGLPGVRRALIGTGFCCPPDVEPFPLFPTGQPLDEERRRAREARLLGDERTMLGFANAVLAQWRQPPLRRLGQMYADVDETFLKTFPELDHYGRREGVRYWGPIGQHSGGKAVVWPDGAGGSGKRVYAYLKDSPLVPSLLEALNRRRHSTVVYSDGVDEDVRRKFQSPTLRFEDEQLDLAQVGRECDVAVHNANHETLTELLLAGRPALQLPITLEQNVLANAAHRTGAAETCHVRDGKPLADETGRKLDALLTDGRYTEAAERFAREHAGFDCQAQRRDMLRRAEELLETRRAAVGQWPPTAPMSIRVRPASQPGPMAVSVPTVRAKPAPTAAGAPGLFLG